MPAVPAEVRFHQETKRNHAGLIGCSTTKGQIPGGWPSKWRTSKRAKDISASPGILSQLREEKQRRITEWVAACNVYGPEGRKCQRGRPVCINVGVSHACGYGRARELQARTGQSGVGGGKARAGIPIPGGLRKPGTDGFNGPLPGQEGWQDAERNAELRGRHGRHCITRHLWNA